MQSNYGSITLKKIAKEAGVSTGTVDRALNNRGRINEQTKLKVLTVAKRLGYKPNAVARMLSKNKSYTIGVVIPEQPQDFFGIILQGMKDAAAELVDYKVSVRYYFSKHLNLEAQLEALKRVEIEEVDGLLINIAHSKMNPCINKFIKKGKPVIAYNSDVPGSRRLCYIGQNMGDAGHVAGELMGKMLRGKGDIALITGYRHVQSVAERSEGFKKVISDDYKNTRIVDEIESKEDVELAEKIAYEVIKKHKGLEGIYCADAVCTIGVSRAMKKINNHELVVIGSDLGPESKQALLDGHISATVCQDPYTQGYYAVKCMSKIFLEEQMPEKEYYYTQHKIVVKYNCTDEYIGDIHENSFREKIFG